MDYTAMSDSELRQYSRTVKSWTRQLRSVDASESPQLMELIEKFHIIVTDIWLELETREARETAHTEALIWNEAIDWHTNRTERF